MSTETLGENTVTLHSYGDFTIRVEKARAYRMDPEAVVTIPVVEECPNCRGAAGGPDAHTMCTTCAGKGYLEVEGD